MNKKVIRKLLDENTYIYYSIDGVDYELEDEKGPEDYVSILRKIKIYKAILERSERMDKYAAPVCPKCGSHNIGEDKKCKDCGQKLDD